VNPHEPDARIAKMKDGSTHLAHKVEHAVDMKTGTVLVVTLQGADQGDTATVQETLLQAGEHVAELLVTEAEKAPEEKPQVYFQGVKEVVTDKGHQSGDVLVEIKAMEVRTYIPEKKQTQRRDWDGQKNQAKARAQQEATYANRRRVGGAYRKSLLRKRGELVERSFAHCYETGGMRRTHLRGQKNILKRLLIHVGAFNLGFARAHDVGSRETTGVEKPACFGFFFCFLGYSMASRGSRLKKHSVFNPTTAGTPKSLLSPISAAPFERTGVLPRPVRDGLLGAGLLVDGR
jgi:transposase